MSGGSCFKAVTPPGQRNLGRLAPEPWPGEWSPGWSCSSDQGKHQALPPSSHRLPAPPTAKAAGSRRQGARRHSAQAATQSTGQRRCSWWRKRTDLSTHSHLSDSECPRYFPKEGVGRHRLGETVKYRALPAAAQVTVTTGMSRWPCPSPAPASPRHIQLHLPPCRPPQEGSYAAENANPPLSSLRGLSNGDMGPRDPQGQPGPLHPQSTPQLAPHRPPAKQALDGKQIFKSQIRI